MLAALAYLRHGVQVVPDSWVVFVLASASLLLLSRKCEYGPSFTYAWLWLGLLSWLIGSDDARALFYLTGFGLVVGWYAIQLVQRDIWSRILVYWSGYFPAWCISPLVRLGDVLIHILPFTLSLPYYDKVQPHHVFQAICYERIYFYAIEGRPIGDGSIVNKIYALQPPCSPGVFKNLQMLSTVGYFIAATVCVSSQKHQQFLQVLWLSVFLFVALSTSTWPTGWLKSAPTLDDLLSKAQELSVLVISPKPQVVVIPDEIMDRILKLENIVSNMKKRRKRPTISLSKNAERQMDGWRCVCTNR